MTARVLLARCLVFTALLFCAGQATAQAWPAKPVRLIVNVGPGVPPDLVMRFVAPVAAPQTSHHRQRGGGGGIATGLAGAIAPMVIRSILARSGSWQPTGMFKSLPVRPGQGPPQSRCSTTAHSASQCIRAAGKDGYGYRARQGAAEAELRLGIGRRAGVTGVVQPARRIKCMGTLQDPGAVTRDTIAVGATIFASVCG
jgi:hypothetical protein